MSDQTFEQLWRFMMVYFPECPLPIAQQCVNTAYSKGLRRGRWAGQRASSVFNIEAPIPGTGLRTTLGSTTFINLDSVLEPWDSTMLGKQVVIDGVGPYYTILAVDTTTLNHTITTDIAASTTAAGQDYTIQQIYLTPPSDFASFLSVIDQENNWKLHLTYAQEQLDYFDGQRSTTGTPFILAGGVPYATPSGETVPRPRFELWPRTAGVKSYPYHYVKRLPLLSAASDRPIFPFVGDVLRHGALAELALWPGTKQLPNPYFDMQQHMMHRQIFEDGLKEIERDDQELAQTMISYHDNLPFAPFDASWLQTHGGWPFI